MPISPEFRRFLDLWRISVPPEKKNIESNYIERVPTLTSVPDFEPLVNLYEPPQFVLREKLQEAGLEKWQSGVVVGALGILSRLLSRLGFSEITVGELREMTNENWEGLWGFRNLGPKRIGILKKLFRKQVF